MLNARSVWKNAGMTVTCVYIYIIFFQEIKKIKVPNSVTELYLIGDVFGFDNSLFNLERGVERKRRK